MSSPGASGSVVAQLSVTTVASSTAAARASVAHRCATGRRASRAGMEDRGLEPLTYRLRTYRSTT